MLFYIYVTYVWFPGFSFLNVSKLSLRHFPSYLQIHKVSYCDPFLL